MKLKLAFIMSNDFILSKNKLKHKHRNTNGKQDGRKRLAQFPDHVIECSARLMGVQLTVVIRPHLWPHANQVLI